MTYILSEMVKEKSNRDLHQISETDFNEQEKFEKLY